MSFDSTVSDAALARLEDSVSVPTEAPVSEAAPTAPVEQTPQQQDTTPVEGAPVATDSGLDGLDLSVLPEDVQQKIREGYLRNADYTRKTQEIAQFRQAAEQFGGVDQARAALDFTQRLNSDPAFAQNVYQQLHGELSRLGILAPNVEDGQTAPGMGDLEDEYSELPPEIMSALNKVNELEQRLAQQDAQQAELQLAGEIQRQEMAVRQAMPNYTDADMEHVYRLAWSTGGDVWQAHQLYEGVRQHAIQNYLNHKESVPAAAQAPPSTASASELPARFESMNDPRLHRAALERLSAAMD